MFHRLPEKQMHLIKWALAIGWLTLITSLIWDPISPIFTDPNNTWSPFHLPPPDPNLYGNGKPFLEPERSLGVNWETFQRYTVAPDRCVMIQGKCAEEQPYGMGARIFWAIIVPIGLVIIHIFGHELWRRICPLSFFSQIPRALGIQRKRTVTTESGKTRQELVVVDKDSWLGKNYLYLQFFLFFIGLNVRLLFVNSDRTALACFLLGTIGLSILVGYLYAGKSWCQYFCPMAPVQMVYTGPRGLLDSYAHLGQRHGVTQSTCRAVDSKTGEEKSACVSCNVNCIDIDSERSYWDKITGHDQKLLYYGYVGFVIGFYFYYTMYAGTWTYYYSGAWTHEETQLDRVFGPGFYFAGQAIPWIPKIIAAPISLAAYAAGTYFFFEIVERIYRHFAEKLGQEMTLKQLRHNMFTLCTVIAWNIFWSFGSRPNLNLVPAPIERLITGFLVICSGLWLYQTWGRTEEGYQRESLANNLRRQLDKLGFDMARILNRPITHLKPDEIFVLAKVLPTVDKEQRLKAYRGVLQEALQDGNTNSADSLATLQDVREQLGIDAAEHYNILAELGVEDPTLLDPERRSGLERQLRINSYYRNLEFLIVDAVESGTPVLEAIRKRSQQIAELKAEYQVTDAEDQEVLARLLGQESTLVKQAETLLWQYLDRGIWDQALQNLPPNPNEPVYRLLRVLNSRRAKVLLQKLLGILEVLGGSAEALRLASNLSDWSPTLVKEALDGAEGSISWHDRLGSNVVALLEKGTSDHAHIAMMAAREMGGEDTAAFTATNPPSGGEGHEQARLIPMLEQFLQDTDPLFQATSLYALSALDMPKALNEAKRLEPVAYQFPLLLEIVQMVQDAKAPRAMPQGKVPTLQATLKVNGHQTSVVLQKPVIQVGSAASNDIVIRDTRVGAHHVSLYLNDYGLSVRELGTASGIFVGNKQINNARDYLSPGDVLRFTLGDEITLTVNWGLAEGTKMEDIADTTLEKLLYLHQSKVFHDIQIPTLLELASYCSVQGYNQGDILCKYGDPTDRVMILTQGQAEVRLPALNGDGKDTVVATIQEGETIGELGAITHSPRTATVVAKTEVVQILSLEAQYLNKLVAKDSSLANGLLVMVSQRLQDTLATSSR